MVRVLLALLLLPLLSVAAPVPKAVKAKPTTLAGVWELVELISDGKPATTTDRYCRLTDDSETPLVSDLKELATADTRRVETPDPERPTLKRVVISERSYSTVYEVDGDELRQAFARDHTQSLTECKPAQGVYYFVFRRVKDEPNK